MLAFQILIHNIMKNINKIVLFLTISIYLDGQDDIVFFIR